MATLRNARTRIGSVAVAVAVAGIAMLGIAHPAAAAGDTGCYGGGGNGLPTCTGLDPQSTGCSSSATTRGSVQDLWGFVNLRYSSGCNAKWAQFVQAGESAASATMWVETSGGLRYTKAIAGYVGENAWTKMVTGAQSARACVQFWDSGFGQTVTRCTSYL